MLRQGAPLVTSLMIAGAVGSAITADLGARQVREEIDAMKVMGLDPVRRLVAPRVVAAIVVAALLSAVVATTAIVTGFALIVGSGDVSSGTYLGAFISFGQPTDLLPRRAQGGDLRLHRHRSSPPTRASTPRAGPRASPTPSTSPWCSA